MGQQGVQKGGKEGGLDVVYSFPHRVRDVVRARSGGVRRLGEGPGYLFRSEGGIVLITHKAEERGRWGFGGEEMAKERLCYLGRVGGPW